jgi:hypothetical protein
MVCKNCDIKDKLILNKFIQKKEIGIEYFTGDKNNIDLEEDNKCLKILSSKTYIGL